MRSSANQQPSIVSTNAFAALDTKTKKKSKKSGRDKDDKSKKEKSKATSSAHPASSTGFSSFPAVTEANAQDLDWAEDEDDDGFGIVPMASWVQEHQQKAAAQEEPEEPDEPEGNHQEMVDIAEQLGLEVAHDEESEEESEPPSKPASRNVSEITQSVNRVIEPKPEEKQLSKKEKKQKEMQELQAVLGELGLDSEVPAEADAQDSKKKKKKKEKPKVATDTVDIPAPMSKSEPSTSSDPIVARVDNPEKPQESAKVLDPAEAKKRLASKANTGKKKKTAANPAFSRAAAEEAKVRAQKEAAQKDKDKKKHYNQQERR